MDDLIVLIIIGDVIMTQLKLIFFYTSFTVRSYVEEQNRASSVQNFHTCIYGEIISRNSGSTIFLK